MNPLTNIKNLQKLNERELELGIIGKKSWHDEYKDSAWIFVGGLPFDLTEGDILCAFSQYGEIVNINLVRDHKTGKSKGFAFLCYEDQRSTVLTVDNLNGIKILGRTIRVDHVKDYKMPKEHGDEDDLTKQIRSEGCAPKIESSAEEAEGDESEAKQAEKKAKKKKKKEKKKKKKKREESSSNDESPKDQSDQQNGSIKLESEVKEEKIDPDYDRALNPAGVKREGGRERKPQPGYSRGDKQRSRSRSLSHSSTLHPRDKVRGAYISRNQDGDSESASGNEADGSGSKRNSKYKNGSGSGRGAVHGHLRDEIPREEKDKDVDRRREDSREHTRVRRREDSPNRRRDKGRDGSVEEARGRRGGSREKRRDRSRERGRERSRERDRQDKHYRDRDRDRYR